MESNPPTHTIITHQGASGPFSNTQLGQLARVSTMDARGVYCGIIPTCMLQHIHCQHHRQLRLNKTKQNKKIIKKIKIKIKKK